MLQELIHCFALLLSHAARIIGRKPVFIDHPDLLVRLFKGKHLSLYLFKDESELVGVFLKSLRSFYELQKHILGELRHELFISKTSVVTAVRKHRCSVHEYLTNLIL